MFSFASSIPLEIASVISFALPKPWPTIPFSFPTTTIEEKLNVRPTLVILVTLLIPTNLSTRSKSAGVTLLLIFAAIFIKVFIYLLLLRQLAISLYHDINNHYGQTSQLRYWP